MSVRASTSRDEETCSGDMYSGDPSTAEVRVSEPSCGLLARPVILEIPKSSTLTIGVPSVRRMRNRFAGLRSRCTIPSACASAMASQACRM